MVDHRKRAERRRAYYESRVSVFAWIESFHRLTLF